MKSLSLCCPLDKNILKQHCFVICFLLTTVDNLSLMLMFYVCIDPQGFVTIIEYVMSSFFLPSVVRLSFLAVICCQGIALNGVEPKDHNGLIEV